VELAARQADPRWRLYTLAAQDRFGQHGIVALAFAERSDDAWRIDTFLMSCRVIGQGVESALLAHLRAAAEAEGAVRLIGEFKPTAKNAQVRDFYERHGFELVSNGGDGSKTLQLVLPASQPVLPAWIGIAGT
jgi:FkbH-like protein